MNDDQGPRFYLGNGWLKWREGEFHWRCPEGHTVGKIGLVDLIVDDEDRA